MAEKQPADSAPTQKTLKGTEIPVPKRSSIFKDFRKIVRPTKSPS